eukprot:463918-Pleurochrysis_carterae.AAC.1
MAVKLAMLTCVAAAAMAHGVAGLRFHTSAVVSPIVRKSVALGGQRGRSNVPAMLMPEVAAALAAAGTLKSKGWAAACSLFTAFRR